MTDKIPSNEIEYYIKLLKDDKISHAELIRRLMEQFVLIAVKPGSTVDRSEVLFISITGEDGMVLPVFTSSERFVAASFTYNHEKRKVPFDNLMHNIKPDIGVVINPGSDSSYLFKWFILQEHIEDFGREVIKQEVTPEWLERINASFLTQEMPPEQRAVEAMAIWSKVNGVPLSMSGKRAKRIIEWFHKNTKPRSDIISPIASAAFYYDASFWEITIPLCYGAPVMNPLDMLRMPISVKQRMCTENDMYVYLKIFADACDYYYTIDDMFSVPVSKSLFADFVASGRENITQATALLLGHRPNPKAAEVSRFALEIFLKTYLIANAGMNEKQIKSFGHRLDDLLVKCLDIDPKSDLRLLDGKLSIYPDVSARYRIENIGHRELWIMYKMALTAGAVVLRPFSDRNTAKTICFGR